MWTHFWDMHSGGGQKLDWAHIYIEAPQDQAEIIFYNRFDRNPHRVTCTCCGSDYSLSESQTLREATAFHRGCAYDDKKKEYVEQANTKYRQKYIPLTTFLKSKDIKVIYAKDINPSEKRGTLPEEGYVWR